MSDHKNMVMSYSQTATGSASRVVTNKGKADPPHSESLMKTLERLKT